MTEDHTHGNNRGDRDLPEDDLRYIPPYTSNLNITDELDRHLALLLALNPILRVNFRSNSTSKMDADTKRILLADMLEILNIKPLNN